MFIYLITNTVNNKVYVGQTVSAVIDRWCGHLKEAKFNPACQCRILNNAIRKYGAEAFEVKTILQVGSVEDLNYYEKLLIKTLNTLDRTKGYNQTLGGRGHRRLVTSEETREKIRAKLKGRPRPKEVRDKIRASSFGKKMSNASRDKMSKYRKGRPQVRSEQGRESFRQKMSGDNNPMRRNKINKEEQQAVSC
jgi:group I intron endonuclease